MEYSQLKTLLERPKGEESVFRLYQDGRQEELKEVYKLFLATKVDCVLRFDEILANTKQEPRRVTGVYGGKGIGKSTMASTVAINQYLSRNIDSIRYMRYNPQTQRFEELFNPIERPNPSSRVTFVDDVSYFVPDFVERIFIKGKGSIECFDKFVSSLLNIQEVFKEKGLKSVLVYVSDSHSLSSLREVFTRILYAADRNDLIELLPKISKSKSSGVSTPFEICVDREFYGKTYAMAGGNIELYRVADIFGNAIQEESGILASNPRLLRSLIKMITNYSGQINFRLFENDEIAKMIVKGQLVTSKDIAGHLYRRAGEVIAEFYSNFYDLETKVVDELEELYYKRLTPDLEKSIDDMIKSLGGDGVGPPSGPYPIPLNVDLVEIWRMERRYANRTASRIFGLNKKISTWTRGLGKETADTEKLMKDIDLQREVVDKNRTLAELGEDVKNLIRNYSRKIKDIKDVLDYYNRILENPQELSKHHSMYAGVKKEVIDLVSTQPSLFSTTDIAHVKTMIDNPSEAIKKINPHTIRLISEMELLPY
jgi:hypothetical protein